MYLSRSVRNNRNSRVITPWLDSRWHWRGAWGWSGFTLVSLLPSETLPCRVKHIIGVELLSISRLTFVPDYSQSTSYIFGVLFQCCVTMHASESFSGPWVQTARFVFINCRKLTRPLNYILCFIPIHIKYCTTILCDLSAMSQFMHHFLCAYTVTVNARSNIISQGSPPKN